MFRDSHTLSNIPTFIIPTFLKFPHSAFYRINHRSVDLLVRHLSLLGKGRWESQTFCCGRKVTILWVVRENEYRTKTCKHTHTLFCNNPRPFIFQ